MRRIIDRFARRCKLKDNLSKLAPKPISQADMTKNSEASRKTQDSAFSENWPNLEYRFASGKILSPILAHQSSVRRRAVGRCAVARALLRYQCSQGHAQPIEE